MKLVTAEQMRALDRVTIERYGIRSLDLMERAGHGVAACVRRHAPTPGPIAIVLGKGNNAGDGLVAARHLRESGYVVRLFCTVDPSQLSPDAATNWRRLQPTPAMVVDVGSAAACEKATSLLQSSQYIIDALLGTGLSQNLSDHLRTVIHWINAAGGPVIAVDIPSGLSADTGRPIDVAIRANVTVTFGLPKIGCCLPPADDYVGALEVVDIGIPPEAVNSVASPYHLTTVSDVALLWPRRAPSNHKGSFGHVCVIAGSTGMIGAGWLASRAGLRSGAGRVTYALPAAAYAKFDATAAEVMLLPLPDEASGRLTLAAKSTLVHAMSKVTAVAIGPGLGVGPATTDVLKLLCEQLPFPMVIDADGLNGLAADTTIFARRKGPTVITPHPVEMGRLAGCATPVIEADRLGHATRFAATHGVICVLKGHRTIIAAPDGTVYINSTGNVGMATAGSGDVLTGIIGGLLAQKMPPLPAAVAGVYLHGLAGDCAATKGTTGMIASDIIEALPQAVRVIEAHAITNHQIPNTK